MMRINLLKITCLFLCFSCLTTASVYGQWSKKKRRNAEPPKETPKVEVLDNNPKNAENLHFLFYPFHAKWNDIVGFNPRLEAHYRKDNKWSIGAHIALAAGFKSENYYYNMESSGGTKTPMQLGVEGDYFFKENKKQKEYKFVVNSDVTGYKRVTHYYVPVKGYAYHYYGARGGLGLFNGSMVSTYSKSPDGTDLESALPTVTEGTLHIGISRLTIHRIKAKVHGFIEKTEQVMNYIYLDLLVAGSFIKNDLTAGYGDIVKIDSWKKNPVGFRLGYKSIPSRKKINYQYNFEVGYKPGLTRVSNPTDNLGTSFFFKMGVGLGIGLKK